MNAKSFPAVTPCLHPDLHYTKWPHLKAIRGFVTWAINCQYPTLGKLNFCLETLGCIRKEFTGPQPPVSSLELVLVYNLQSFLPPPFSTKK